MKNKIHKLIALLVLTAAFCCGQVMGQTTLFSDNFTADSSANWVIKTGSGTAVDDYTAQFAFNYATNKFVRNGVTNTIPLAPNSATGIATNGVKVTVNKNDAVADTSGLNLYPNLSQTFSNDYALKFDMWLNYNGGDGGGSGSTEFSMFGVNMSGTQTNWTGSPMGDGVWFAVTGEGGAARDYRSYVGDAVIPGAPLELQGASGGFLDRDGDTILEQEVFFGVDPVTAPLNLMFPKPTYETMGLPSKQWVQVEIRQRTNTDSTVTVTWLINGYVIASLSPDPYLQTSGNVMIGTMDPFASIASPKEDNFVIFDNVRVVDLSGVPTNEVVSAVATDATAAEPSGDDGLITISRTGSTASALEVPFRMAGSATRGSDYVTKTNGVTFTVNSVKIPAGASSVDVAISVVNDGVGEPTEQAILVLAGSATNSYDLGASMMPVVNIADDGDLPFASVSAFRRAAYEGNTNSYGQFRLEFSNPYANGDVTVNYTLSGTAANGTHYTTIGNSAVILSGTTNAFVTILPIDNNDTVSNRTVILTLATGANYNLSSTNTNTTVVIFNDDLVVPAVTTAYSDNFDVDSSPSWTVSYGTTITNNPGPSETYSFRDRATFAYDYSADGIPSAPHSIGGTTKGLKMEANVITLGSALFSGLSASPTGKSFVGDFRMRLDWWQNYPGPLPAGGSGSTQLGMYGITRGTKAQWPGATAGTDSVFFAMSGDGGTNPDIRAYTNGGAVLTGSVYPSASQNNTDPYYAVFGSLSAPAAQLSAPLGANQTGLTSPGAPGEVWHDVVITKLGSLVTWHVDGLLMATVNVARFGYTLSTNIFVGESDINAGQSTVPEMQFGLFDNLVVETLPIPDVAITNITLSGASAILTFTGGTNDAAAAYLLQQAPLVVGPYTNVLSATITNVSSGVFRAITTTNAATQFYRIRR